MKLGKQTGSLTNHIMSRMVVGQPEPVVGMGATLLCWTDSHGATITNVRTERGATLVTVRQDHAKRVDNNGMSESQTWKFEPNHHGAEHTFRREPNGMWTEVRLNARTGRLNKVEGLGLRIGERHEYYDFSF